LYWSSLNEQDFLRFEVERSADGINFIIIGIKNASAGSGRKQYELVDDISTVSGSRFYYRLKMIDMDGRISYSKMILIRIDKLDIRLVFYPNPVTDNQAQLLIHSQEKQTAQLQVIDQSGRALLSQQTILYPGNNTISVMGVTRLARGTYLLSVMHNGKTDAVTFVVAN
jgi:hypothetical protein